MVRSSIAAQRDLADLTGALYEATAQPDLWPDALDKICDALGGAALVTSVHRPGGMAFGISHRLDPEADKVLREHYANPRTNPLFAIMPRLPVLAPVTRESVMEDASYLRSGLFNDVFRAQGFVHAGLSCLARENEVLIPCGILRRKNREFGSESFHVFEAVLPHLRRALELTVRFSDLLAERQQVEAVANAAGDGFIVADASARVLYSNRFAERVLSAADGLRCRCRMLTASRTGETSKLHQLISEAALRFGYLGGSMNVSRPAAETPWALIIMPTPEGLPGSAGNRAATALVRLVDMDRKAIAPEARLIDIFGFTKAEAVVAAGLMESDRPKDIAERRNLRITTVRTHIRSIYLKTGTFRQAELIRLLLQVAGPHPQI